MKASESCKVAQIFGLMICTFSFFGGRGGGRGWNGLACENIRSSSLFAAGDVSRGGTSATQQQKFHTDDANQCLHNKSGSHRVPNINLSRFMSLLVDCGKVLCSSAKEFQQNSNTSSREDYIPQILTVLSEILHIYI